jgi:hypothetical protein
MTTARQITAALKGRWHGRYGMASCPSHPDGKTPALKISDDPCKSDGIDLHCFGGCPWRTVKSDLVRRGILEKWRPSNGPSYPKLKFSDDNSKPQDNDNYETAKETWQATDTLNDTYLVEARGLQPPWPKWLRYHGALKHAPTGLVFPCLVAGVVDGTGKFTAIHRTYLKLDGSGKAGVDPQKMALGALQDGTVRLGQAGKVLGLAEGIETGLSAQQLFEIPVWCVLGRRFDAVTIPDEVIEVQIFADRGEEGEQAAQQAKDHFLNMGKRIAVRRPPQGCDDWNDALPKWSKRPVEDWEF